MSKEITVIDPKRDMAVLSASPSELSKARRTEAWADAVKTVAFFGFLSVAFYSTCQAVCA